MLPSDQLPSEFLQYLATHECENSGDDPELLPTMDDLTKTLGVNKAKLHEQIEVARFLGLIDVRPRRGMRRQPYKFFPSVRHSLMYAIARDWENFAKFSGLRNHVEEAYWFEAAELLTDEDKAALQNLMDRAWEKLNGNPIRIPHPEHRELHLQIYQRLENPFVQGILEAFWDAYEAAGLNLFAEYAYLQEVWGYHQQMVSAICEGDLDAGHEALKQHIDLLYHRPGSVKTE